MSQSDDVEFPTLIRPIVDGVDVGWKAKGRRFDGTDMDLSELAYLELTNSDFGTLAYGKNPVNNFDSWAFHEIGGGGSVTIPYVTVEDELLIGVVEQNRPNQGGKVLNVPRGFLEPGETYFQAADRELAEEVGNFEASRWQLPGIGVNPDSAFFETVKIGEGAQFFAAGVPLALLVTENNVTRFRKSAVIVDKKNLTAEQITDCYFITVKRAMQLGDMFTLAGVGRLMAAINHGP